MASDERADDAARPAPGERDPADVDGFDLEALWRLCEPPGGAMPPDPLLGSAIDGVRLSRVVGEGGMARVYLGERIDGTGTVAVKVLRPGFWSREALRRFAKESQILRRLDHPGISKILAVGACDLLGTPVPAIVMEFVAGAEPITAHVRKRSLDAAAVTALFAKVCDAVAHGHALGVVHRDLKPGNVLVGDSGEPKVIDFGVARGRPGGMVASTFTVPGGFVGTLQYMSPEQVDGADVDARSDVHALGSLFHEMLTGRPPHDLAGVPVVEAARLIRESRPPRIAGAPPHLAGVVARCLEKDPARRFADAGELAAALRGDGIASRRRSPSWSLTRSRQRPGAGRRREAVRGALVGLAAGSVLLVAIQSMREWSMMDRSLAAVLDGATALAARLERTESLVFEHGFRGVGQFDADRWLVAAVGMRKWEEDSSSPRTSYWGPVESGVPGRLEYRFEFPVTAERIEVHGSAICWDFSGDPRLGVGRGAARVSVSRDGREWITLHDGIGAGTWGESWGLAGDLPAAACGTRTLWFRVELVAEGADDPEYTVAQFARGLAGAVGDIFSVRAYARGVPAKMRR